MYTTIHRNDVNGRERKPGDPLPQVIDHRSNGSRWLNRRKEQLPYDTLKKHRDALLEEEFKYKKLIKELEKERDELVVTYENTYQENQKLKSIVEYGPDAAKLKQLTKDKREQKGIIEQLEDENKALQIRLKELERLGDPLRNNLINKTWTKSLDKARKMREAEDAIPTQGPFVGNKLFKKKRIAIDDTRLEEVDAYDLQLDVIEKESEKLVNKIKQLKREKERIDYTRMMGKGAVIRNAVVANAISEKLNRDLNKYAIRLEQMKLKQKRAQEYLDAVQTPAVPTRVKHEIERNITSKTKIKKTYKANRAKANTHSPSGLSSDDQISETDRELLALVNSSSNPASPRVPFTKAAKKRAKKVQNKTHGVAWAPKIFDRPDTYSELHQSARIYSAGKRENNSNDGNSVNSLDKTLQSPKQQNKGKTNNLDTKRLSLDGKIRQIDRNGDIGQVDPTANNNKTDDTAKKIAFLKSTMTPRTSPIKSKTQRKTKHQSDHHIDNDLQDQFVESHPQIPFRPAYNEKRSPVSPELINFNNQGRTVGGIESRHIVGNSGIRHDDFSRYDILA